MSAYIKLSTLEYPRHEGDIRLDYPEILESQTGETFPCPETYAKVRWTNAPAFDSETQKSVEGAPEQVDGAWRMTWAIVELTQEELDYRNQEQQAPFSFLNNSGSVPDVIE